MTDNDTQLIGEKLRSAVAAKLRGDVSISLDKQETTGCITIFRFSLVLRKMGTEFRSIVSVAFNEQMWTNPTALSNSLDRMSLLLARQCVADFVNAAKESFAKKAQFN